MPGPAGGGEGARAVPARAQDHADGGDLVLGLHDGGLDFARFGVGAELLAVGLEGLGHRGGRRDGVPGAHGGAAVDHAQCRGGIALDKDAITHGVGPLHAQAQAVLGQVLARELGARAQGLHVAVQQLFLALVLFGEQGFDDGQLDLHQLGQRAQHEDVLEQRALAWVFVGGVANGRGRHADGGDVVPQAARWQGLGAVVEQVAARVDLGHVGVPGLRVHGHHEVDAAPSAQPTLLAHAQLVPGGHALDVAGEDVARADRHAHAQDGARQQFVGAGAAAAIDVGELDDEVVGGFDAAHRC